MRKEALFRAGGWATIVAGVLRAAGAFASDIGNDATRQSLYFIIDVFLLIGVLATYARDWEVVGRWGATGFLTALVGILLVRSSRAVPGLDLYPAGAVAVALGCALLGLTARRAGTGSWWVPLLFIMSVLTAIGGQAVTPSPAPLIASGIIFGAGMVGVGKQLRIVVVAQVGRTVHSEDHRHRRSGRSQGMCLRASKSAERQYDYTPRTL